MKKFVVVLLLLICAFTFTGCNKTPAENTYTGLTNVTSQLTKSINKLKTTNQSDLASLSISPNLEYLNLNQNYARFYTSEISDKVSTSGERANLDNYILKLEEIYKLNVEILNKNASINKLREELNNKMQKVHEECENIKKGLKLVEKHEEEFINSCIKALRRTAENIENKKQYFNNAKQKFISSDLNKPESTLIKGNTLLAEMDNVYVDLNFASATLDTTITILSELKKSE